MVSFMLHNVFKVRPRCSIYQYFIPFYCQIIFSCIDIPHLFIHASVDRHLGCFQILAVTNNAVMSICINIYLYIGFYLAWVCN